MELTAQEVYMKTVSIMQPKERLRLAALILQDLTSTEKDYSNSWNEKDQQDLTFATLKYAEELYPEEQELV